MLRHLQSLNLHQTKVTNEGLKELAALKQLQWLNVVSTQVTDAGLEELAVLKQLRAKILDGEKEAKVIALCCGAVPSGHARWTLRLLAERIVELDIVEAVSHETVRHAPPARRAPVGRARSTTMDVFAAAVHAIHAGPLLHQDQRAPDQEDH